MTRAPRRTVPAAAAALAAAAVAALAAPALAGNEYTASSFTGGWEEPPAVVSSVIGTGQDDRTAEVALPFEFPFFGRLQTKVSVCSNGFLAFGSSSSTISANAALPTSDAPNGIVAALWDDLTTGTGSVSSFVTGAAPDRVLVISWDHVDTFSGATDDDLSFQVKLHETSGVIEIAYATTGTWDGLSYTAGIEDPTGTVAFGAGGLGNANAGRPSLDWRFTPNVATVTGTLLRDRPVAAPTGLGGTTETGLPVAGIDLELLRADTGEVAARGRTAADGTFALPAAGVDAPLTFSLDVLASGVESRVTNAAGATYRHRLATGVAVASPATGTLTLDASVDAGDAAIRRAVNVQQAAQRGFAWARDAAAVGVQGTDPPVAPETFPNLEFRFVPGTAAVNGRTHYVPGDAQTQPIAHVHDAADNPDAWDDDVVLRECGHHVFARISVYPGPQGPHLWATATAPESAFTDGFATWFACAVQGRATFIDTKSATTATVFDLEAATPAPAKSPSVTGAVACSLWDLVDGVSGPDDPFDGTNGGAGSTSYEVFRTIDLSLDANLTGGFFDARSFFDAWRVSAPALDRVLTARVFIHHGALDDDAREPNDNVGEESAIVGAQRLDGLVLNPWNDDRFEFAFAPAADAPLTVAVTQTTTAVFEVEVRDAADAHVAFATNADAADKAHVVATSASALPAGTYRVRVGWTGGGKAAYSLAFFEPLALASGVIAPTTVGQNFKVEFAGAGGVPPYAFATTASVPGVSVARGGAELVGVPTKAGTYPVRVTLTDASGSGTSFAGDLSLVVNPALRMPAWLGVRSGDTVGVDLGTGGTGAVWTSGSGGDGGLAVQGGPTLRLVGSTGAPRSFDVTASASDTVGATLTDATSHVVVCPPLPARGTAPVAAQAYFGFWFDAFAATSVDLRFRFRGRGDRPVPVALVSESGETVALGSADVESRGFSTRLRGVRVPTSGTWFVVFQQKDGTFEGSVRRAGRVKEPREAHGLVVVADAETPVEASFEATCGARLRILLRGAEVPRPVDPTLLGVRDPEGTVSNPAVRRSERRHSVSATTSAPPLVRGTFVLVIGSTDLGGARTGPVFWRVRIGRGRGCATPL